MQRAALRNVQRATGSGPVLSAGIGTGSSAGEAWHCEHCEPRGYRRWSAERWRHCEYLIELRELVPVGGVDLVVHVLARLHVPARVEVPKEQPHVSTAVCREYCSTP
jgi:hypothetical protein